MQQVPVAGGIEGRHPQRRTDHRHDAGLAHRLRQDRLQRRDRIRVEARARDREDLVDPRHRHGAAMVPEPGVETGGLADACLAPGQDVEAGAGEERQGSEAPGMAPGRSTDRERAGRRGDDPHRSRQAGHGADMHGRRRRGRRRVEHDHEKIPSSRATSLAGGSPAAVSDWRRQRGSGRLRRGCG